MDDPHGLWILGISVAALLLGPAIHAVARRAPATMAALDNFVLVVVVGMVALEILPRALQLAGLAAFAVLVLGVLGPALADGPLHRASRGTHGAALALAIVGMAIHSFTDGLALASAHAAGGHSHALEAAVLAHQLPAALAVWWLLAPTSTSANAWTGWLGAAAAMVVLGLATIAGFLLANASFDALAPSWLGILQALFAGFFLHITAHRSSPATHPADAPHPVRHIRMAASLGGLVGLGLLAWLARDSSGGHPDHGVTEMAAAATVEPVAQMLTDLVHLTRAAAPPLIVALGLALLVGRPLRRSLLRRGTSPALQQPASGPLHTRRGPARNRHIGLAEQHDRAAPVFAIGLVLAATLAPWLGPSPLPMIAPALQVLVLAILGVPAHVYAPAATPLVALLVGAGLGPGAALAFILSGPATELGALGRRRIARARSLMAVAFVLTITLGLLLDLYVPTHLLPAAASDLALATLAALLLASFIRQTPQQFLRRLWPATVDHDHDHDHPPP